MASTPAGSSTALYDHMYYLRAAERSKTRLRQGLILLVLIAITAWAAQGTEFSIVKFVKGLGFGFDFFVRSMPPNLDHAGRIGFRLLETMAIALLGTTFGALFAIPLAFLASRNIVKSRLICQVVRVFIDSFRGISEVVWAFLMVAAVGLGPFPGVLALTIHNTGSLGKYFSETIENTNPGILEAAAASGANPIQIAFRAVFPELRPLFSNYVFFYFEASVRAATILGIVGAGGIGLEFIIQIKQLNYPGALTVVIAMLLLVILTDRISALVRRHLTGVEMRT